MRIFRKIMRNTTVSIPTLEETVDRPCLVLQEWHGIRWTARRRECGLGSNQRPGRPRPPQGNW